MNEIQYFGDEGTVSVYDLAASSYPDGAPLVRYSAHDNAYRALLRPSSMQTFVTCMFWADALRERGRPVPDLILPLMPGSRQDRLNPTGDYLFTAKSVAQMINARHFPSVTVLDPHSDVTPALLDRCRVITAAHCINPPAGKYQAVISPDAGAEKRAGLVARKLGVPLIHAWKTRDVATGEITDFGCAYFEATKALVVDDICDGGGTFIGLREAVPANIALDLYVTHGLFTKGTAPLLDKFNHVYCTDSVVGDKPGVIVVPVCKKLLETGAL